MYLIKKEKEGRNVLVLYTEDGEIANVNENNEIVIMPMYRNVINEKELLLQLRDVYPISLSKMEELENKKQTKQEENMKKTLNNENKNDIEIDINKKITQNKSIKDLVPEIKEKQLEKVKVRRTNSTRFLFYGIDNKGNEVALDSIKQTEGTNPNKEIIEVNADGSKVVKNSVLAMMKIENGTNEQKGNEGFTVDIGEYGIPKINYYRRSPETNEYTSIPVNLVNTNQKRTELNVREYMEKKNNSTVDDNIERAQEELIEKDKTELENIDDDIYNDKNGKRILLEKAAKRCRVSYEAFVKEYEKALGDTVEEKIEEAEEAINEQYIGKKEK